MNSKKLACIGILFSLLLSWKGVALASPKFETREDVLKDREEHISMITRALKPAKKKLADHYSGKHTLDQEKVKIMEKRIATFDEKLTNLINDLSEEEIQNIIDGHALVDALRERKEEEL